MSDLKKQYDLWDEFLAVWPESRLATMTLDEYTKAGSKDTFTYWMEARLDKMGSIWGGSSFKFGIYSRKVTDEKPSDATLRYSAEHAWYTALGDTAEQAFLQVRQGIVRIARLAAEGDREAIGALDIFGSVYRWKIAFHYQNRQTPQFVNIFTRAPLRALVGDSASLNADMASLQRMVIANKPPESGILEYGQEMWETWSRQNLVVWKLSHGDGSFTKEEQKQYRESALAVMHGETGKSQGKKFVEVPNGTLFYLCNSNSPQLVGQFTSPALPCSKGPGWLQRSFRVLKLAQRTDPYTESNKGWSPCYNSTFSHVGRPDLALFNQTLLQPYFGISLAELAALAGEHLDAVEANPKLVDDIDMEDESDDDEQKQAEEEPDPSSAPASGRRTFNRIYYGPPGTGKTYQLDQLLKQDYQSANPADADAAAGPAKRYRFVTFHQSYGYEEFVEGLRPVLDAQSAGQIRYEIRAGVFKELCAEARRFPEQHFAMVIDEINRGNVSKIFGELITLIELDKREGAAHAISLTLPYSGEAFSIPPNVDIIGTMNTADRSLALVDTALRRRFDFVPRMPDSRDTENAPLHGLRITLDTGSIDIPALLTRMNQRIESLYDRDHTIGHAYLTALRGAPDGMPRLNLLKEIFRNKIIPLLEEYFFEDWQKIRLVLGDNQKARGQDQSTCFITAEDDPETGLVNLFGANHGLESFNTRKRFSLNGPAFSNPDAYIGIYAPAK
ncbi:AAA family ATPase [Massilia violaceinigra]|uniref:AAA family ATPase n=1 Tax=Massilia violaceinigra TaxID=2045208 RepID=A0ABY4AF43_9BURK|nr:AAA family ATPase [Massilia violaceinigra]UOD32156.1 AAA family ATPase [Massilia violaceinigra]